MKSSKQRHQHAVRMLADLRFKKALDEIADQQPKALSQIVAPELKVAPCAP